MLASQADPQEQLPAATLPAPTAPADPALAAAPAPTDTMAPDLAAASARESVETRLDLFTESCQLRDQLLSAEMLNTSKFIVALKVLFKELPTHTKTVHSTTIAPYLLEFDQTTTLEEMLACAEKCVAAIPRLLVGFVPLPNPLGLFGQSSGQFATACRKEIIGPLKTALAKPILLPPSAQETALAAALERVRSLEAQLASSQPRNVFLQRTPSMLGLASLSCVSCTTKDRLNAHLQQENTKLQQQHAQQVLLIKNLSKGELTGTSPDAKKITPS